jgi:hypothetical protein
MASQHSPGSKDSDDEVYDLPNPVPNPAHFLQPPPSPPPTIKKKLVSIFSKSAFHVHDSQRKPGGSKINPLDLGHGPQSPRRTGFKLCGVIVVLVAFFSWWRSGNTQDLESMRQRANLLAKNLFPSSPLDSLSFIPANNRHIHVSAE